MLIFAEVHWIPGLIQYPDDGLIQHPVSGLVQHSVQELNQRLASSLKASRERRALVIESVHLRCSNRGSNAARAKGLLTCTSLGLFWNKVL